MANCNLWTISSLLPTLVDPVYLGHSRIHLFAYYLWLLGATMAGLNSEACNLKYLLSGALEKNLLTPALVAT